MVGDFNGHIGLGVKCAKEVSWRDREGGPGLIWRSLTQLLESWIYRVVFQGKKWGLACQPSVGWA